VRCGNSLLLLRSRIKPRGACRSFRLGNTEQRSNCTSRDAASRISRLEMRLCSLISGRFLRDFWGWSGRLGRSIRPDSTGGKGKTGSTTACATICALNGTNLKSLYKTIPCSESRITSACYLCNTHPKTDRPPPFGVVPLLRVQGGSVIVMQRRRGASRGRPVKWFA
jgi:hypothetical protein